MANLRRGPIFLGVIAIVGGFIFFLELYSLILLLDEFSLNILLRYSFNVNLINLSLKEIVSKLSLKIIEETKICLNNSNFL